MRQRRETAEHPFGTLKMRLYGFLHPPGGEANLTCYRQSGLSSLTEKTEKDILANLLGVPTKPKEREMSDSDVGGSLSGTWMVPPSVPTGTGIQLTTVISEKGLTPEVFELFGKLLIAAQKSFDAGEPCPSMTTCGTYKGPCGRMTGCGTFIPPA
jgi:hypothetical protein